MAEIELLDLDTVKSRLQLRSGSAPVDSVVTTAILGVKPLMENWLQSKFDLCDYSDAFYVDADGGVNPGTAKMYRLKLATGFVRADAAFTVYVDTTFPGVMQATAQGATAEVVDPTTYKVTYDKGYLLLPDAYADMYVRVDYTAGYSVGEDLPRWVTESAFMMCARLLTLEAQGEIKADMQTTLRELQIHGAGVLDAHLRATSAAISPIQ